MVSKVKVIDGQLSTLVSAQVKGKAKVSTANTKLKAKRTTTAKAVKTAFPLVFKVTKRDPNDFPIENILEREVDEYREKYVEELLASIQTEANDAYHRGVERYQKLGKTFKAEFYPKVTEVEIGKLKSDEDINRELDVAHATDIFVNYDEQCFQPVYCIKTPGKDEWTIVNGQHTATSTAAIVEGGFMTINGKKVPSKNWKKFKILVIYIETHDRSTAREAFALLNGEMSKRIDVFDKWKQHYLSVRLDNSANPVYKHTYNLIQILKQYNCTPLPADHDDVGEPGAITHLAGVESLAPTADYSKVIFVFSTRDKFWNNLSVDNAELGFYGTLFEFAQAENVDMNGSDWDQFLNDLHATVQGVYRTMNKLKSNASKAFKQYRFEQFTDKDGKGAGFTLSLYFAYQAYIKLGGKFVIKALKDLHVHKGVDALQYLEAKQITQINTHASATNQIVKRSIQLPKKVK
jgi:hypothetical protein